MSIESVILSNRLILCCPFSFCLQSFPASESFQVSRLFPAGGKSIRASASASVLPLNIQGWFPLVHFCSKEFSPNVRFCPKEFSPNVHSSERTWTFPSHLGLPTGPPACQQNPSCHQLQAQAHQVLWKLWLRCQDPGGPVAGPGLSVQVCSPAFPWAWTTEQCVRTRVSRPQ